MIQIHTSHNPKERAAAEVNAALEKYRQHDVLLLLAGGSALDVLEYVDTNHIDELTTIMMMDERFSRASHENNFLQMTQTLFYTKLTNTDCNFIPTIPDEGEVHEVFCSRINNELTDYLEKRTDGKVVALFGIGPDGHTAAVFPMKQEDFTDTYGQGQLYTHVTYEQNPFQKRTTITPKFISQYVDLSAIYAVGEEKREILESFTQPHKLHELPACIHTQIGSSLHTDLALHT